MVVARCLLIVVRRLSFVDCCLSSSFEVFASGSLFVVYCLCFVECRVFVVFRCVGDCS